MDRRSHETVAPASRPARISASAPIPALEPSHVVVINDISVPRGGATSVALATASAMQKLGIPATFITGDDAAEIRPEHADIDYIALTGRNILDGSRASAAMRGVYSRRTYQIVANWIAENDTPTTVYHLHGWSKSLSPSIFAALRPVRHRLAIHAHDNFLVCPNGGYFDYQTGRSCPLTPLGARCLARNCDRRSYSHKLWRSLRQVFVSRLFDPSKVGIVLPVHEEMIPLLARGGILRERMQALRNPVTAWCDHRIEAESNDVFLYVGRLDSDKGVMQLAEASRLSGVRLRMIGTGPLEGRLRTEYPEIELCGWRSRAQIAAMLDDARMFIMPSTCRETFGLAIFEALLSGIPVAVSEHVMAANEINKHGIGLVFDPSNTEQFAAALRSAAADDALIDRLSHKAFEITPQLTASESQWAKQLFEIYKKLLHPA